MISLVIARPSGSVLPELVLAAGERTSMRFLEFFAANIRNPDTRPAYARAAQEFLAWCADAAGCRRSASPSRCTSHLDCLTGWSPARSCRSTRRLGARDRCSARSAAAPASSRARYYQAIAYKMISPRAAAAGIAPKLGNYSFRATGITTYLKNGGTLEKAAAMANHASTRTTRADRDLREGDFSRPATVFRRRRWLQRIASQTKRKTLTA
jgi:hypothetical protein